MPTRYLAWLNEIGLLLAVVGGVIIFFWGLAATGPGTPMSGGRTTGDSEAEAIRRRRRYQGMARFGLLLIISVSHCRLGWLCQFQPPPSTP